LEDRLVPSTLDHFEVLTPSTTTAGDIQSITVIAEDAYGQAVTDYTGTIHFHSSADQTVLPYDFHFTVADQGRHTFADIISTAGSQTVTVNDTGDKSLSGSASIQVSPGALSGFVICSTDHTVAGDAFMLTVTAVDAYGNQVTNYTGTIHFQSSDCQATLPYDFHFTQADQGSHTFAAIFRTAGVQYLTVNDVDDPSLTGCWQATVDAAAMDHFAVCAPPRDHVAPGEPFGFTIVAQDAYGNCVTNYTGTVHFSSSDCQATLPPDFHFTLADQGTHTFAGIFLTEGCQTITVTDVNNDGVSGYAVVVVDPATASHGFKSKVESIQAAQPIIAKETGDAGRFPTALRIRDHVFANRFADGYADASEGSPLPSRLDLPVGRLS
jgi:hypothetical protein